MTIPLSVFFYFFVLMPSLLMLVLLFVVHQYNKLVSHITWIETGRKELARTEKEAVHVLESAEKKAARIIDDAKQKAGQIVEEAATWSQDSDKHLSEALAKATAKLETDTAQVTAKLTQELGAHLSQVSQRFAQVSEGGTKALEKKLQETLNTLETEFAQDMQAAHDSAMKELEGHKARMIETVNRKIVVIAQQVSLDLIGKKLPLSDQESLVLESLEKAKRDNVL